MTKHLSREQLLRHVDGELSRLASRQAAAHLKTCWVCQVELDHLKAQIADIVDAQSAVFEPSLPPPPGPWERLEPRLGQSREESAPAWRRHAPFAGWSWRASLAYCGTALAVVAVELSLWFSAPPVLAKEVLKRVSIADGGRLAITEKKVVRQRVRLAKISGASSGKSSRLNSWKSHKSTYWEGGDLLGAELRARYRLNGLESALPLSPEAMQTWVKLAGAEPKATQDEDSIGVQVTANAAGQAQGLEGVSLHVSARNWHLDEMTITFSDATYQLSEEESAVIAREDVPSDVMAHLEPVQPDSTMIAGSPAGSRADAPPIDLNDLEMGVRSDLHRIGADLGEDIEIVPLPPNRLRVEARQVDPETKENLVAVLGNKRGVQLAFQAPGNVEPGPKVSRATPPAGGSRLPTDPLLARYFGSEEAQENLSRLVLERSDSALAHLYAMRELADRWSEDQERALSADARSNLQALVRDHSRAVMEASSDMRNLLAPLSEHFGIRMPKPSSQLGASWRDAASSGLEAARRLDRTLRSLLTQTESPLSVEDALPRLGQSLSDLQRAMPQP